MPVREYFEIKIEKRTLELTHALEREKELNEMKSRFVTLAFHEFRTPLSAILSSISLIEHYLAPEYADKREKHIDRVKASVKNMTNILNDFLSVEKLEQGKMEIKPSKFDLNQLIERNTLNYWMGGYSSQAMKTKVPPSLLNFLFRSNNSPDRKFKFRKLKIFTGRPASVTAWSCLNCYQLCWLPGIGDVRQSIR